MKNLIIILLFVISNTVISQNIFTEYYPSNENYRALRVKEDFNGNFVISGYKDIVSLGRGKPYAFKVSNTGQKLDSMTYFSDIPFDWYFHDVLIDSTTYYFIGYSGDWKTAGFGPNDSSMFLLKTDYNLNHIDTNYYSIVDNHDIGYSTSKFDLNGNIITAGYYFSANGRKGSFINKIDKNGDLINSSFITPDSNRMFINIMIDSDAYYLFSFRMGGIFPRLLYKYDTLLNLTDTYIIPPNVTQYYSPIKFNTNEYFTSGTTMSNEVLTPSYQKFAIIKSTIEGVLLDSLEFGVLNYTNYPAFYDALCMQNGNLFFAGSVYNNKWTIPPYGEDEPSNLYIAKIDTSLNIIWEKLIGGDAYYSAMNVIATSDGGILMMASRNDLNDNKNNLDIILIKMDTDGNITWTQEFELPKAELLVYPNPAENILNIKIPSNIQINNCNVLIYNNLGQNVFSQTINDNETSIDISRLKKGVHILVIESKDGWKKTTKFIKY